MRQHTLEIVQNYKVYSNNTFVELEPCLKIPSQIKISAHELQNLLFLHFFPRKNITRAQDSNSDTLWPKADYYCDYSIMDYWIIQPRWM